MTVAHPSRARLRRSRARQALALALAGTFFVAGLGPVTLAAAPSAANLTQYQNQEKQVTAQLGAAEGRYTSAMAQWRAAVGRLDTANRDLYQGQNKLKTLIGQTNAAQNTLTQDQAAVSAQQQVVAKDKVQADVGLVTIDEHGAVPFLSVLLGAHSFPEFLTRLSMLRRIWDLEVSFLRRAEAARNRLVSLEQAEQAQFTQLTSLKNQAAAEVVSLSQLQRAAAQDNAQANAAVADAQAAVNQLAYERSSLQQQIQAILNAINSGKASWSQILTLIDQLAKEYGLNPSLVEAVVLQESGGNSKAVSSAGAEGLMQLMPSTAAALGVTNAFDPVQNLQGGIQYLVYLLSHFHGNLADALAAYNAGPGAVEAYGGIPPYTQTQNYVRDVMALYNAGK